MNSYAIHSFSLPISTDYLTVPVYPLPVVHIAYRLWYNKKIDEIHMNFPMGVPVTIKDWTAFDEHVRAACESNSKRHVLPGTERGGWMSRFNDPLEVQKLEEENTYKR